MPLAKRIIPTILVRGKTAYKGKQFVSDRSIGSAVAIARTHAARGGIDEIVFLDVSATAEGRGPDLDLVREITEGIFVPVTFGGGVRSLADIDALLRAGADKVCIGRAWSESPDLIENASQRFGSQAIVVSIDVTGGLVRLDHLRGHPAIVAQILAQRGAGEILLQSIDRDGMMCGYDLDLVREVSNVVSISVIASGGCGEPQHMLEAFRAGADACAAGAMFAWTDYTPKDCAKFLKDARIPVRL